MSSPPSPISSSPIIDYTSSYCIITNLSFYSLTDISYVGFIDCFLGPHHSFFLPLGDRAEAAPGSGGTRVEGHVRAMALPATLRPGRSGIRDTS